MYKSYDMGIRQAEHIPFYNWCREQGVTIDLIKNDPDAFWVRWHRQDYRVPPYGRVDRGLNYLIRQFRAGGDIVRRLHG